MLDPADQGLPRPERPRPSKADWLKARLMMWLRRAWKGKVAADHHELVEQPRQQADEIIRAGYALAELHRATTERIRVVGQLLLRLIIVGVFTYAFTHSMPDCRALIASLFSALASILLGVPNLTIT